MRFVRPLLVAALVVTALAVIVGCGGSSSSSSSPSTSASGPEPTPTKPPAEKEAAGGTARAALIKEGDAICQATDEVTETLQEEFKKANTPGGAGYERKLAGLLVRFVVIGRTEAQELASLEPAANDRPDFERWLTVGGEGLGDFEAAAVALKKGNSPKFNPLYEKGQSTLAQANEIASKFGFKVCGGQRI